MAPPDALFRIEISPWLVPLLQSPGWRRDDETDRAVRRGLQAIAQRDWGQAADWIAYAQRRIRNDATLTFALAEVYGQLGNPQAADMLAFLAERTDWPEAWWRLALCHWREGREDQARQALQRRLSTAAPPHQGEFAVLADRIAGERGWCGLDNSGRIMIGGGPRGRVKLALDGEMVRGRKLGADWRRGTWLSAEAGGVPLIGSPIAIGSVTLVEGFVSAEAGMVSGWCWLPGEPELVPTVMLAGQPVMAREFLPERDPERPFAMPRRFQVMAERAVKLLDAIGPHGRRLLGAPIQPWLEIDSAQAAAGLVARRFAAAPAEGRLELPGFVPIPADLLVPPVRGPVEAERRVLVVIPVYRGLEITLACLESVLAARSGIEDVLVIADGAPDRELVAQLHDLAGQGGFSFDEQAENRGFVATANRGLRAAAGRDVVLLNNDTVVPPGWLGALRDAVSGTGDIGTATPLSNNATIFSYPDLAGTGAVADAAGHAALAARINQGVAVEVPTAHGFCMYIRWECLQQTGLLREDVFAQGYGEENDFCLRARALGWRHVAAAGCVVAHHESVSFGTAKNYLRRRNLAILNRLHPGYDALIAAWLQADPLLPVRRALDLARLRQDGAGREMVLLVTHHRGGGVARHVRERAAAWRRQGLVPLVLQPRENGGVLLDDDGRYPNLIFDPAAALSALLDLLRELRVRHAEIHHFIGHDLRLIEAIAAFVPYDIALHDFAWYCPRITLTRADHRYCGEPDLPQCDDCIADLGGEIEQDIMPSALHPRSAALLAGARRVLAPSADTAKRYARRFGVQPAIQPWEDEAAPVMLRPERVSGATRRMLVAGAVSYQKGYDLLLALARLVRDRKLPLEIILVGYSIDDARLLATGAVRITGEYREEDLVSLIQAQDADFAFLPAQWPETWSYVLSSLWQAGLPVVALDLGAPAERIRARGGGKIVPPHLPPERLAALMLDAGWVRG